MAGLSEGLLNANVYAADMSSIKYRSTMKMIEVSYCRRYWSVVAKVKVF